MKTECTAGLIDAGRCHVSFFRDPAIGGAAQRRRRGSPPSTG